MSQYNPVSTLTTLVAGSSGLCSPSGDKGIAIQAGLNAPTGVVVDGIGNLFILETDGVRFVDATQTSFAFGSVNIGNASTVQAALLSNDDILNLAVSPPAPFSASVPLQGPAAALTPGIISNYVGGSGGTCAGVTGEDGLPAADAYIGYLNGMAMDSAGNMYLSDLMNSVIWNVDPSGYIHLFAGTPGTWGCGGYRQALGGDGGPALSASFGGVTGIAFDAANNMYLVDNTACGVRRIDAATQTIATIVGQSSAWGWNTGDYGEGNSGSWHISDYVLDGEPDRGQLQLQVCWRAAGGLQRHTTYTAIAGGVPGERDRGRRGIHSHGKRRELCFELGGAVEWRCAGYDLCQQHAVDGGYQRCGYRQRSDQLGDGCNSFSQSLYIGSGVLRGDFGHSGGHG